MMRRCEHGDFEQIWSIINDGAQAYKGVIPADCWTEPYMSRDKLQHELDAGVMFWAYDEAEAGEPEDLSVSWDFNRSAM